MRSVAMILLKFMTSAAPDDQWQINLVTKPQRVKKLAEKQHAKSREFGKHQLKRKLKEYFSVGHTKKLKRAGHGSKAHPGPKQERHAKNAKNREPEPYDPEAEALWLTKQTQRQGLVMTQLKREAFEEVERDKKEAGESSSFESEDAQADYIMRLSDKKAKSKDVPVRAVKEAIAESVVTVGGMMDSSEEELIDGPIVREAAESDEEVVDVRSGANMEVTVESAAPTAGAGLSLDPLKIISNPRTGPDFICNSALISLFVGSGIALALLRFRYGASTKGKQSLLDA